MDTLGATRPEEDVPLHALHGSFAPPSCSAVAVAAVACSKSLDMGGLETQLENQLNTQLKTTGITVDCPSDVKAEAGGKFDCTATIPDCGDDHRPRDADGQRRERHVGGHWRLHDRGHRRRSGPTGTT